MAPDEVTGTLILAEIRELRQEVKELATRTAKNEWQDQQFEKRLNEGSETFAEMRRAIKEVGDAAMPKPLPRWQLVGIILGPIVGLAVLISGFVWQAARYPDRGEFNKAGEKWEAVTKEYREKLEELTKDQITIKGDVNMTKESLRRIEQGQTKVEGKIDALILQKVGK